MFFLSGFKAFIGVISNSIAITLDAVNNLSDALFDAILSGSVLFTAIIYLVFGLSLEAYVGIVISAFIIKSGIEMLRFDVVLSFDIKPAEALQILCKEVQQAFPNYTLQITPDLDLTE